MDFLDGYNEVVGDGGAGDGARRRDAYFADGIPIRS